MSLQNKIDKYIVIDCKHSDFEYIKSNILNSELNDIFDLNNVDWFKIEENSQKSIYLEILNLWNSSDSIDVKELSGIIKLHPATVSKVLKNFDKIGLTVYDAYRGVRNSRIKKVNFIYQFTEDMEFIKRWLGAKSITEEIEIPTSTIYYYCKGTVDNVRGFIWKYEKDLIGWSVPIHNNNK